MADRAGFEPAIRSHVYTLSRRAPSTTRPPVRFVNRASGWVRRIRDKRLLSPETRSAGPDRGVRQVQNQRTGAIYTEEA